MKRRIISELVGVARDLVEVKRSLTGGMATDGGPGSGNFGHKGRPGEVGGSAPGEGGGGSGSSGGSSKSAGASAKSDYGQIKAELGREKKGMASANNALGRPLTAAEVRSIGNRNPTVETLHADFSLKSFEFRKAQEGYRNGKVSKERYDSALKEKNDSFDRLVEAEKYADGASSKSSSEGKSGFENSPAGKIAKALGKENEFNDRIKQNMAEAPVDRTEQEMAGLNRTDKTRQIVSELRGNSQKQSQAPRKFKSPQEEKEYYSQEWKGAIDRMQHYGALARRRIRSGLSDDLIKQAQSEYRTAKAQAIEFEKKYDSIP